jgi:uncharacterized protein
MKWKDAIIVMTRLPREGRNKTRLIPALGPMGATEFHDRLARHAIGRASAYALMNPGTKLQVQLEGGSALEGQNWLGEIDCYVQKDGDLGQRLQAAVEQAFSEGADRVLVMGTDCPSLDEPLLAEAFDSLERADLVFGPAADGGYYLVGLTRLNREIFENIEWGGPQVLKQSLAAAATCRLHVSLLGIHSDVDVAEDLSAANAILTAGNTLSVIVPTLNEELHLLKLLEQLKQASPYEIIVVDGGSSDGTVALAEQAGVRVIKGPRGRASQMNLAAAMASGEFLLFLHADTLPPPHYPQVISRILQSPGTSAGAFRFALAGDLAGASLIESLVHFRCRLLGLPYGDQGLFIRRQIFFHVGGFPDWPVLEDLHIVRRLKQLGPVRIAPQAAMTSSRRWEKGGTIRTFLRHQWMLAAYYIGIPPRMIARRRS